jgi:hypothetical protein
VAAGDFADVGIEGAAGVFFETVGDDGAIIPWGGSEPLWKKKAKSRAMMIKPPPQKITGIPRGSLQALTGTGEGVSAISDWLPVQLWQISWGASRRMPHWRQK